MIGYIYHNNNNIVMVRGDTFEFDITILDESTKDERYILKDDDVLYLGIMDPNQPFECALVKKRYTADDLDQAGNLIAVLEPEDTVDLVPGIYYYSVKLHRQSHTSEEEIDKVYTIIQKTKFTIVD